MPPCSEGLGILKKEFVPNVEPPVVWLLAGLAVMLAFPNRFGVPGVLEDVVPKRLPPDGCVVFPNILLPAGFAVQQFS